MFGHGRPFLTAIVTGKVERELDRIRESVNAELPHYMRLRQLYRADEAFTPENGLLTANQKLQARRDRRALPRQVIEQMYQ